MNIMFDENGVAEGRKAGVKKCTEMDPGDRTTAGSILQQRTGVG